MRIRDCCDVNERHKPVFDERKIVFELLMSNCDL